MVPPPWAADRRPLSPHPRRPRYPLHSGVGGYRWPLSWTRTSSKDFTRRAGRHGVGGRGVGSRGRTRSPRLGRHSRWRVGDPLVQALMGPRLIEVVRALPQHPPQVPLAQNQQVVEAVPAAARPPAAPPRSMGVLAPPMSRGCPLIGRDTPRRDRPNQPARALPLPVRGLVPPRARPCPPSPTGCAAAPTARPPRPPPRRRAMRPPHRTGCGPPGPVAEPSAQPPRAAVRASAVRATRGLLNRIAAGLPARLNLRRVRRCLARRHHTGRRGASGLLPPQPATRDCPPRAQWVD
jgi:hypothetical protein